MIMFFYMVRTFFFPFSSEEKELENICLSLGLNRWVHLG